MTVFGVCLNGPFQKYLLALESKKFVQNQVGVRVNENTFSLAKTSPKYLPAAQCQNATSIFSILILLLK